MSLSKKYRIKTSARFESKWTKMNKSWKNRDQNRRFGSFVTKMNRGKKNTATKIVFKPTLNQDSRTLWINKQNG